MLEYIIQWENGGIIFFQNRNAYFEQHFQELIVVIYSSWYPESTLKSFWGSTSSLFAALLLAL